MLVNNHQNRSGDGDNNIDTLKAVNLLGVFIECQRTYIKAGRLHRLVLKGREKAFGLEHPCTLTSASNLGLVFETRGRYEEAEAMMQ